jgi:hypothetical protein
MYKQMIDCTMKQTVINTDKRTGIQLEESPYSRIHVRLTIRCAGCTLQRTNVCTYQRAYGHTARCMYEKTYGGTVKHINNRTTVQIYVQSSNKIIHFLIK